MQYFVNASLFDIKNRGQVTNVSGTINYFVAWINNFTSSDVGSQDIFFLKSCYDICCHVLQYQFLKGQCH
jgi:hypothetical protein